MRRLVIAAVFILLSLVLLLGLAGIAHSQLQVPPQFVWQHFSAPFQSVKHSAIDVPGGLYGGQMYVSELGGGVVSVVNPAGVKGPFSPPVGIPLYAGPVGLAFDPTGLFGGWLYVSESATGNLWQVNPLGVPVLFTAGLSGTGGVAFDPLGGPLPYGGQLYCAQWGGAPGPAANTIMMVNPVGLAVVFCPGPLADPRYLAFDTSPGFLYGGFLYATEFANGNITPITPLGLAMPPISNGAPGLEGLAFGLGDIWFGPMMYAANLTTGAIMQIPPGGGPPIPWGACATGAAYIQFVPGNHPYAWNNLPTMYLDDGNGNIYRIGPNPATSVMTATWSQIKARF